MITIGKPYITRNGGLSRLNAEISIDEDKNVVWLEVDSKFEPYLCVERGDAFLCGVLHYAMCHGHDIRSEAPIGEHLYYQLETDLIFTLVRNSKKLYATKIVADIDSSEMKNAGGVGTGISCGVDSLHVLAEQGSTRFPKHKLNYLTFFNVGSHGEGERAQKLFCERLALARKFSAEYGYELIAENSNLQDVVQQSHFISVTFSSMFAVFALQKLWCVYYCGSGGDPYAYFSVKNAEKVCSEDYEQWSLTCFSTPSLRIYQEGGDRSRLDKLESLEKYPPSYKYLNVCTQGSVNCCRCEKCARTLIGLDAIDSLEKYREVFDVDYYNAHKKSFYLKFFKYWALNGSVYFGVYPRLKTKMPLWLRGLGWFLYFETKLQTSLRAHCPEFVKKTYRKFRKRMAGCGLSSLNKK